MEKKGNKYLKIVGLVFIIFLMTFFVKGLISKESSNGAVAVKKILGNVEEPKVHNPTPVPSDAGDFQEVYLSWGVLNYKPKVIKVKKDIPVRITADTKRLTGCYRSFIIDEFNIKKSFKENDNVLEFIPDKKGKFIFGCAMGMGVGEFIVE